MGSAFSTIKDHVLNEIQKNYKYGFDIVDTLRLEDDKGTRVPELVRATIIDEITKGNAVLMKMNKNGFNFKYVKEQKKYNKQKEIYKENKHKAYAYIMGFCNKTMENCVMETKEFETEIRNNLFRLFEAIKQKMYGPTKSKYDYLTLTSTMRKFLLIKQEDDKTLTNYTKRFKQLRDNFQVMVRRTF